MIPWTAARQASLSITNSWSLLKLMSIPSVMPGKWMVRPEHTHRQLASCVPSAPDPSSPLPPVHSTCVFITPDFFVTRKMKKKANPSDNEGLRVQFKLLRFSYFMCRATTWSVQVPNFLNLRQKWKKKICLLPAKHYNCSHIESYIKITWVLFTVPLSRLYFWPKTLDVGFGNFDI